MPNKNPNRFDNLLARFCTAEAPVELVLVGIAIACVFCSIQLEHDEYAQECLVEVAVGSTFFLAIYLFDTESLTPEFASFLLGFGLALGFLGWLLPRDMHLLAIYILKAASAIVLFVVIEQIIRGILIKAAGKRAELAKGIQAQREKLMRLAENVGAAAVRRAEAAGEAAGDAAATTASVILVAVPSRYKLEYTDEGGQHHPAEGPKIPDPLFELSDEDTAWSMAGIFGATRPKDQAN